MAIHLFSFKAYANEVTSIVADPRGPSESYERYSLVTYDLQGSRKWSSGIPRDREGMFDQYRAPIEAFLASKGKVMP